ncbi:ATP-grasp domain-containing protein [Candidatus Woesearchaeota archaeon]|nr:ATP-grasp domain-containing protein [Candidatus Woesearchaeota archaeon]
MRIGILYNLVDKVDRGKEDDKLADNEVLETAGAVKAALERKGHQVSLVKVELDKIKSLKNDYDFIFNLAEGIDNDHFAEPMIAAELRKARMPFSGADDYALALCMNKIKTKRLFQKNNIPTPEYKVFKKPIMRVRKNMGFPLIVKPAYEDGSIGIDLDSIVNDSSQLKKKVNEIIASYKQPALVERFIDGREVNAGIIGNKEGAYVLPLSEIMFELPESMPRIVSFSAKWMEDSPQYKGTIGKCPAELPKHLHEKITEAAKKAFKATGCRDYARVDFRINEDEVYAIEVNPNPCINPNGAGFIRSAGVAGYDYDSVINKIVEVAVERHKKKIILKNNC